ncbi:MAG TPA: DNA-directed RNA polymerase subunit beta' [Candidatus Marinimicrobia bacterium]|nr:DNA-directed RNA polymerase subunit beta' [Candidatus Neomarinimicrobiota bacterium]MDP6276428.1 DNA-directed RNA polymerase subunit beta' [Candidatus Neomarinimicrobiota bacterium]MDP7216940.1 DNA-directed RNA polymerase subunit beta' [Candidatus Neomarinimicrobiota bacterium]MDP7436862.1 DNA-directed RNA polymerase subunit beta' [Candidatus Neomarinimicrobiota bacterium]HBN45147.1 DNA-directed RNA polymerase subunit beta' [Candidatus Neomarinimicrobiota bacterium]
MTFIQSTKIDTSKNYNSITISLASPEMILTRSYGEVLKPETINYRSYKPEKDGLFCEKIFGPVKDYECHCGKYKGIRYRGIICDRCGVEVTRKRVRRERMGHITLAVPVVHIWYLRSIPSKLSYLLGLSTKNLERIIYYEIYVIIDPGASGRESKELIDEDEFLELETKYGFYAVTEEERDNEDFFYAAMGGEALRELLSRLNMIQLKNDLVEIIETSRSKQKRGDALKRLKVAKALLPTVDKKKVNNPEWMVVSVLPVMPPELRPLVPLDGGRFAASDLNDLYRRIIIRNNRLKQLMEIKAPDVILRNEKRMLQESVDALFDNNRRKTAIRSGTRRPLKSISDMLRGKTGRFRQNLLGKRVDYSGRSVIVVGPELNLNECGLPKKMALELFKPHMINELIKRGFAQTPRGAKLMIENSDPIVFKVLEYVVLDHPVLLNRAPTLHRLGIQAFQPVLVDGKAIKIHPLVCAAFNADFDGDQMAVHVPLSLQAQTEARILMLSSHNILHPANGKPIAIPSQDMVLGCHYLTRMRKGAKGEGKSFGSFDEVIMAYENKAVDMNAIINVRHKGQWHKDTSVGRVIFNAILPDELDYFDEIINKKSLQKIVNEAYLHAGNYSTVEFLDKLKDLGFNIATKSGSSISISDVLIPGEKDKIIESATKEISSIQSKFDRHILTEGERYNKVIDIWTHATNQVAATMMENLKQDDQGFNPVYMMADSGARGSQDQIKQLAGMRGLMAKPQKSMTGRKGEIIESPITSNFKEGLSVLEYFISTHGARKGLADTALKTADAGYLTRRLVDVAQDVVIYEVDCGTINGLVIADLKEGEEIIEPLADRVLGRTILDDFIVDGKTKIKSGQLISEEEADVIADNNVENVRIRSVLTCESMRGVCAKCYGWNLSAHNQVNIGTAVGIQAAQSIGEPGTQLTLRTFHIGGTATRIIEQSEMTTKFAGSIKFSDTLEIASTKDEDDNKVNRCMVRNAKITVVDSDGRELNDYNVPYGSDVLVSDGEKIKGGHVLFQWDPYTDLILARQTGKIQCKDFIEGETYHIEAVEGGKKQMVIVEAKDRQLSPHIDIVDKNDKILSGGTILPVKATLVVRDGQKVQKGQTLVKIPKEIGKTRDITGGLPRVAELFEARNPRNPSVVSEIDGRVQFGDVKRGIRKIHIISEDEEVRKYNIPYGKHIIVHEGDNITAGTPLCEGSTSPTDILNILGSGKVREYLVDEIQEVYRLQGVKINDKHIEVIVRQMMQKVSVIDPGDSKYMQGDRVNKSEFFETNRILMNMAVISKPGDSDLEEDSLVDKKELREINKALKEDGKTPAKTRKPKPPTFKPLLMGITQASLNTESFISAASFQETTRVLTDAAVECKTDYLRGLKENIAVGRLIPAGTGSPGLDKVLVEDPDSMVVEEPLTKAVS